MRAVIMAAVLASVAHAEPRAEELRNQAIKAAQAKDWETARRLFAQSYELEPRPLTLFNLGAAQEHTDHLVDAKASYERFLADTHPGENDRFRKLATDALAALDKQMPTVVIHATGFDAVLLDGKPAAHDAPIAVDPGAHEIAGRRGANPPVRRAFTAARSTRQELELVVPSAVARETLPAAPPPVEHRSLVTSPWFWTAAAVVVAGAVVGGYLYYEHPGAGTPGTLGSVTVR